MEYKINEISNISGVTTRTLRYYDQINLLNPNYVNESGYRIYTKNEIQILQQILLYKELEFNLKEIKSIIKNDKFNVVDALYNHLDYLVMKKDKIDILIQTVKKTINNEERGIKMSEKAKFEGFKKQLINENEAKYGSEISELYGSEAVEKSYNKLKKMSKFEFEQNKILEKEIIELLKKALELKDPSSDIAQDVCKLHEKWIKAYWPTYSKEAHLNLVKMYNEDERFAAYYDKAAKGAAAFLLQAMKIYLSS